MKKESMPNLRIPYFLRSEVTEREFKNVLAVIVNPSLRVCPGEGGGLLGTVAGLR